VMVGIPMIIGLLTVHCIVPSHPAATAVAIGLNADIGKVILYGLIVGLPAAALAGPVFGKMIGDKFLLNPPDQYKNRAATPDNQLPAFWTTLFTILFPLILMISKTIFEMQLGKTHPAMVYINLLGDPVMALFMAVILAYWTLGLSRGKTMEQLQKFSETAIGPMAPTPMATATSAGSSP